MLLAASVGCAGPGPQAETVDQGVRAYRAGEPGFFLDAVATVRGGSTGVDVYLSVPRESLVFRRVGEGLEAVARWTVTVERDGRAPIAHESADTLRVPTPQEARAPRSARRALRFDVDDGDYTVRVVLEDDASDRVAQRVTSLTVRAPTGAPALSGLRLEGAEGGTLVPLVSHALPTGVDSLRAVAQAVAAPDGAVVRATVVRYRADTTAALPIAVFTPPESGLVARGVDLGQADTVQSVRQPLDRPAEAVRVEAPLPALGRGVYGVTLELLTGDEVLAHTSRLVVVRRRDFPQVTREGDLIGPLEYLAEAGEMRRLRGARGTPLGRRVVDRFWGERIDDRRVAAATVRAFYERVEEANRLFSTQKEGWKTDPGMVYILFGPPVYVERTLRGETWTYGARGGAPPAFMFIRTAGGPGDSAPFSVLTLVRDPAYDDAWRQARRLWRTGQPV